MDASRLSDTPGRAARRSPSAAASARRKRVRVHAFAVAMRAPFRLIVSTAVTICSAMVSFIIPAAARMLRGAAAFFICLSRARILKGNPENKRRTVGASLPALGARRGGSNKGLGAPGGAGCAKQEPRRSASCAWDLGSPGAGTVDWVAWPSQAVRSGPVPAPDIMRPLAARLL